MGLEATVICVDNSSFMRNGDFIPTRLEAQKEAVNTLVGMKTQSNPESTVGLLAIAGKRVQVLLSLTRDLGKIMNTLNAVDASGQANLAASLKTAQLVLKNRQNKKQKQRIVLFVGSPVEQDTKVLTRVAKNMKKNNIAVDIINFGYENASNSNQEMLQGFIKAVNSGDNSRLVNIPPGSRNLSDMIVSSILTDSGAGAAAGGAGAGGGAPGGGAGADFPGGVDPNIDPELAMALRMSLEEDRARQQREAAAAGDGGGAAAADDAGPAPMTDEAPAADAVVEDADDEEDEEALLAQAIALSMAAEKEAQGADEDGDTAMGDAADAAAAAAPAADASAFKTPASKAGSDDSGAPVKPRHTRSTSVSDRVQAYERRVQLEKTEADALSPKSRSRKTEEETEVDAALRDEDFLTSLVESLPGVDTEDIDIKGLMEQVEETDEDKDKKGKKDKDKK